MIYRWAFTAGGYVLAAVLLWAYIDAKSDIKAEVARCNSEKLDAVHEASVALRNAQEAHFAARIAELEAITLQETRARQIAEEAALAARDRPERVRTVIREIADEDACLGAAVPDSIIRSLRD